MSERDPEFGPRGYLPPRAAARARKIILRGPLGLGWILASLAAGIVLVVVGVAYFQVQASPPGAPFVHAAPIDVVDPRGVGRVAADGEGVLVVRGGGGVRAFADPGVETTWCAETGRIEGADGRVWQRDGRRTGGTGASLTPLPTEVFDGELFVDPTSAEPPAADDRSETPTCTR